MKAYFRARARPMTPFEESPADLPIGNRSLKDWQDDLLRRFGVEPVRGVTDIPQNEDRIVLDDDLWFTRRVLKSLLK